MQGGLIGKNTSPYGSPVMKAEAPLLLTNISQHITLRSDDAGPRRGAALGHLGIVEDAAACRAQEPVRPAEGLPNQPDRGRAGLTGFVSSS